MDHLAFCQLVIQNYKLAKKRGVNKISISKKEFELDLERAIECGEGGILKDLHYLYDENEFLELMKLNNINPYSYLWIKNNTALIIK